MSLHEHVADWKPGSIQRSERLNAAPVSALAALLDVPSPAGAEGDALPPLWHWTHFLDTVAQAELGQDGHPATGAFLPPIPRRRRMFAGGRLTVHHPLRVGDEITRTSTVTNVAIKQGSTGELLFVTVRHELHGGELRYVTEEQDLVYRSATTAEPNGPGTPNTGVLPESSSPLQLRWTADETLLFRFSALTNNAHRIHYDLPYAINVERFPALVVHGPLLALLMLELPRRHLPKPVTSFTFRAHRPVFAAQEILVTGEPAGDHSWQLAIRTHGGGPAMTGIALIR